VLLQGALGEVLIAVHHIGSTAVPGLAAKPIVDILVEVTDFRALDTHNSNMEAIGYKPKGEFVISGRRYFQKGIDARTHHVHAFVTGDDNVMKHIAFRDYLISHRAIAEDYGTLKKNIAIACDNDISKYYDSKEAFVRHHVAIAVKQKAPNQALQRTSRVAEL
jgi:GrpB-like predicted nucleotidyltransferase (UPF0157 family)